MERNNDTGLSLQDIRDKCGTDLVKQLLEIQNHKYQDKKSWEWVRKLNCLSPKDFVAVNQGSKRQRLDGSSKVLKFVKIPGNKSKSPFVAVSYVWNNNRTPTAKGGYIIESKGGISPSRVQDAVWARTISYLKHHDLEGIWIDQESINQENKAEKQRAMQSMDQVYSNSEYPVGLIFAKLREQEQINMLANLLRGRYVVIVDDQPRLRTTEDNHHVLDLLKLITSDKWWTRAWIFQEEYRGATRMKLLIPHCPSLYKNHMKDVLGDMEGELQVSSTDFREQATLFCLAYRGEAEGERQEICDLILSRTRKYKTILEYTDELSGKAMSPIIFKDVGARHIEHSSDMLAIIANCCEYPVRLNTEALKRKGYSLSLSLLVIYLLNGEILMNDMGSIDWLDRTIYEYLGDRSLNTFDPPVEQVLTFTKGCRFVNVKLCRAGIKTRGLIWKLYKKIDTGEFVLPDNCRDEDWESILRVLASELRQRGHIHLAEDIEGFVRRGRSSTPYNEIMEIMAVELARAIRDHEILHLGCVGGNRSYHSIFVCEPDADDSSADDISHEDGSDESQSLLHHLPGYPFTGDEEDGDSEDSEDSEIDKDEDSEGDEVEYSEGDEVEESYVFTAWEDGGRENIEKYVSIEVDLDMRRKRHLPRLRTKRWINGLFFLPGHRPIDVLFPWPNELTK
jgi:hypothetical protein